MKFSLLLVVLLLFVFVDLAVRSFSSFKQSRPFTDKCCSFYNLCCKIFSRGYRDLAHKAFHEYQQAEEVYGREIDRSWRPGNGSALDYPPLWKCMIQIFSSLLEDMQKRSYMLKSYAVSKNSETSCSKSCKTFSYKIP